jgi:hypothetical protein
MNAFVTEFQSVIWVTLAYISLYYLFLLNGLRVKMRVASKCKAAGEPFLRYTKNYPEILAVDRVQLNTLEHMPPFLALMWLQAHVVSPTSATSLGALYVAIRATYPFFMGSTLRTSFPKRVFINTFSGYAILIVFAIWQVKALLS